METKIREIIETGSVDEVVDSLIAEYYRDGFEVVHIANTSDYFREIGTDTAMGTVIVLLVLPKLQRELFRAEPEPTFLQPISMVLAPVAGSVLITVLNPFYPVLVSRSSPWLESLVDQIMQRIRSLIDAIKHQKKHAPDGFPAVAV